MVSSLEAQLEEVSEKKTEILRKIDESRARKMIGCAVESCGKLHTINKLTLLQTYWYVEPSGCTGGDYWNQGEMQFVCPTTKVINRIMIDNYDVPYEERDKLENNPETQFKYSYTSLFREVINAHRYSDHIEGSRYSYSKDGRDLKNEEVTNGRWVNNYYVDNHRKKFGLVERRKDNSD